jgi:NADPH:quinone reductase-like Zn-dependent oxidoreductase
MKRLNKSSRGQRWSGLDLPPEPKIRSGRCFCRLAGDGLIEAPEGPAMKAIRIHGRGGPEQLVYEDAPKPIPQRGEALVRVMAAGVTPTELSWSSAYATRDKVDRLPAIPGHEFSGIVEALGPEATGVKVGQEVYALADFWRDGSDAEYIVIAASDLAPKPRTLDFTQAAAVPVSALTAWQSLFDYGKLASGQKVLIHGAAGGVGTFAVQLAKWRNAHVIGTASAANLPFLRSIGADKTIDYTTLHFEDVVREVDVALDTVGGDTLQRSWRVVRRGGVIVTTAGEISEARAAEYGVRGVSFIVKPSRQQLTTIQELINRHAIWPVVSAVFPLAQARQAFERGIAGHTRGKMVLSILSGQDQTQPSVRVST